MNKFAATICAATFALASTVALAGTTTSSFNAKQTQDIKTIVHDYLVQNPEVLIEASQALQKKEMQQISQKAVKAIQQNKTALFHNSKTPISGNPDGNIVIVEFYDYRCPHCQEASRTVRQLVKNNSDLRVIYKDFPIFGGTSDYAAKASVAAYSINKKKYDAFHESLMDTQTQLTNDLVLQLAKKSGYNIDTLKSTMNQAWVKDFLNSTRKLGSSLGINGTPAFVLGNLKTNQFKFIPGALPIAQFQNAIKELSN